jgi:ribonuclease HI
MNDRAIMVCVKDLYDIPIENSVNIYTDGSSLSLPRVGGIGVRFVVVDSQGQEFVEDNSYSGYRGASNNKMELYACIVGIKEAMKRSFLVNYSRVDVHSDSLYIVDNYHNFLARWSQNRWCNLNGKPVLNAELWKDLWKLKLKLINEYRKRLEFHFVKGHSKSDHNKAADRLARESARNALNPPLTVVNVRRKMSNLPVDPGCVLLHDQRLSIRIQIAEDLKIQRQYKYTYEVIPKSSPYYGKVDLVFSNHFLKEGHCYSVRFNDNSRNPTINKVFKELPKLAKKINVCL